MSATSTAHTRLWHPFAAMGKVDGHELVLVRGEGCRVWDADGNEYLDATAGLWFANVGHGRAEIADAVADAAAHARGAPRLRRPRERARARARRAARRPRARRRRRRLLRHRAAARRSTPPRRSSAATGRSSGSRERTVDRLAPLRLPRHERVRHVAVGDPRRPRRLRDARRRRRRGRARRSRRRSRARSTSSAARAAAFIGEPMIGAGGAIPPPDGYWPAVERICRERDVLLDRRRGHLRLRAARDAGSAASATGSRPT